MVKIINTITRKEFYFKSSDGKSKIYSVIWINENIKKHKAIIQIVHGMAEHILRYENFACFLASKGFIVCGNDHIGHGKSIDDETDFGYFGEGEYNYLKLVMDIRKLNLKVTSIYKNLPVVIIGHSMGSFISRDYCCRFPKSIKCAIFIGTSGKNNFIDMALNICEKKINSGFGKTRSKLINKLAFGAYNIRYKNRTTDFDWLSSDENIVKRFIEDKSCAFIFTYAGFYDLFTMLKMVSSNSWYKNLDKKLPVFLICGDKDPVGNYGKGVKEVYRKLKSKNVNVKLKIYKNMRHEVLNEKNKICVYNDILEWIDKQL